MACTRIGVLLREKMPSLSSCLFSILVLKGLDEIQGCSSGDLCPAVIVDVEVNPATKENLRVPFLFVFPPTK